MPALLKAELLLEGFDKDHLVTVLPEVEASFTLLGWARPEDVLVLPVHALAAREQVGAWLDTLAMKGWVPGEALPVEPLS